MTGTGSEAFRSRGPRTAGSSSVADMDLAERLRRRDQYGFGKLGGIHPVGAPAPTPKRTSKPTPRRKHDSGKPYAQQLDEAIARAKGGGK